MVGMQVSDGGTYSNVQCARSLLKGFMCMGLFRVSMLFFICKTVVL